MIKDFDTITHSLENVVVLLVHIFTLVNHWNQSTVPIQETEIASKWHVLLKIG